MFHDDGLEVYLKPAGDENDNIKLAEFELSESLKVEGDERTRRCAVLARHGNLKIVVRPSRDFKMHWASALIIQPSFDRRLKTAWGKNVIQRSKAHEQFERSYILFSDEPGAEEPTQNFMIAMTKVDEALRGDFDEIVLQPIKSPMATAPIGSILVSVCRGHAKWIDDPKLKSFKGDRYYGPGDPTEYRKREHKTSRPVDGEMGQWYTFEFRYRSEEFIRTCRRSVATSSDQTLPQASPIGGDVLIEDPYFLPIRKEDAVERQKARMAYKRLQNALENGEDVGSLTKTGKQDVSNASTKKSLRASRPNKPQFCNCPDPSHNRVSKTLRANTGGRARKARPRVPEVYSPISGEAPPSGASNATKTVQPDDINATVCTKCSGLKVPGSQRPGFLQKWYSENPQRSIEDVDDDEELPPPPAEQLEQPKGPNVENTSEVEGADKAADEGGAKNTETPASAPSGDEESQKEAPEPAVVGEDTTTVEDSEELIAKSPNDAATGASDVGAPIATGAVVSVAGDEGKAAPVEGGAADNSDAPTEEAAEHSQATQRDRLPLAGATASRKRASEQPADVRPTKQQRIEIDLTGDDKPVIVKSEESQKDMKSIQMISADDLDGKEDLEAELEDIEMQERELQLQRRKMEVQRRLKALQKESRKPSVGAPDYIKIED